MSDKDPGDNAPPDSTNSDAGSDGDTGKGANEPDWDAFVEQLQGEGLQPTQVAERLKASRRWEQRAKENETAAQELESLRKKSMSEQERAVEEAKAEARAEVRTEVGQRLAAAELRAALTGIVTDPEGIIEDLNLTRYVTSEGDVDAKAVKALADKYRTLVPAKGATDLKQGARGSSSVKEQDNNAWLRNQVTARRN